jgi:hypothetical protein
MKEKECAHTLCLHLIALALSRTNYNTREWTKSLRGFARHGTEPQNETIGTLGMANITTYYV